MSSPEFSLPSRRPAAYQRGTRGLPGPPPHTCEDGGHDPEEARRRLGGVAQLLGQREEVEHGGGDLAQDDMSSALIAPCRRCSTLRGRAAREGGWSLV